MRKRPPKPRFHSTCGHPLEGILLVEVIPAQFYYFGNKEYLEGDIPDTTPEILTEWRHDTCMEKISNGDLEYLQKRIKENGKQIETGPGSQEAEERQDSKDA